MAHEVKIHDAQVSILRELLFHPDATFATLQKPTGLTSDHFTFHISRLCDLHYVERAKNGSYRLTSKGKEYANRLDTDNNTIERQPKVAVILALEHTDGTWLFQERLKNPYYGFWGFPTGKMRWGEKIKETAARELDEETGLRADHRICGVYHEIVRSEETQEILEDKMFFVVHCTNPKGTLQKKFEGGRNAWRTVDDINKVKKKFSSVMIEVDMARDKYQGEQIFFENSVRYNKQQF